MKKFYLLLKLMLLLSVQASWAQVLDPNDPVVVYNASSPPTEPAWGQIGKWVKTNRVSWSTTSYKAYIYKGMQFRLKWPKNYDPLKKYPIAIFFHGLGEKGTKYDNEYQLYHGGQTQMQKVDNGSFDGFLLYPQNLSGYFGPSYYDNINELINNFFVPQLNVDPFRVSIQGLSAGGSATWDFLFRFPKLVAAATPISAAQADYTNTLNTYKFTPIWLFQGGSDPNPPPQIAQGINTAAQAAGANFKLTVYPGQGHGVWNLAWGEADFYPYISRAYKSNPWPLNGRTEFCPNDPIAVTLGLTPGFNAYEWRKDGVVIPGATSNTLNVTTLGTYDARINNGSRWSDWSPAPVVIKTKTPTVSPAITVAGIMSNVIPTPAGSDSVVLSVPTGYASYSWKKTTDATVLGTGNTLTVRQAAEYQVKVTEQFGCSSDFSSAFKVVAANGANGPDAATGLIATAASRTEITLNWNDKPNPVNNETAFEVYRSLTQVGGYELIAKVNADVLTFANTGLIPNTAYYYIIRSVNNNGAAPVSNQATATTLVDNQPPTIPGNLTITTTSRTSVGLSWTASTDDVGVDKYDIYVNGLKAYSIPSDKTSFLVAGLTNQTTYAFTVKARDLTGNSSGASNQVSATTYNKGLSYKFYTGTFSALPDFNTLTPVKVGTSTTPDITVRTQNDNFAFLWEGFINIPVSGNYTFETYSDDGSKLYIGTYNHTATALVNNDGLHGSTYAQGTINLTAGVHPIAITFFEQGGGEEMKVYWKNTASGIGSTRQLIPASAFTDPTPAPGAVPAAPDSLVAKAVSYNKVNLTWHDESNNETGFEIYRSTALAGTYDIIATAAANATSYSDSGSLAAQTTYYYKIKAINKNGDSGYSLYNNDGLKYDYFEAASTYSALPSFTGTPAETGNVNTFDIGVRNRNTHFAIKFDGWLYVPTAGSYTFYTSSDAGSKLYIDGFDAAHQVVSNDHLSGTVEKSGVVTLTAGYHRIVVTYFEATNTRTLTVSYAGPGITKRAIPAASILTNPNIRTTTLAVPATPAAPSALVATPVSTKQVNLKWNDNSANEDVFEIWRSTVVNTKNPTYLLLATKTSSDSAYAVFVDTTVQANAVYNYKVRAKNIGGTSSFSNEATVTTPNTLPVLAPLANKKMRFDTQLEVALSATDEDGDVLAFSVTTLPPFAALTDNGNGTGTIVFSPALSNLGEFPIEVTANDGNGGLSTQSFTLTVDNNFQPVLNPVTNVSLAEKTTSTIALTATDQNTTDVLTWTATGLPSFATLTPDGNNASILVAPGYADNGTYTVTVKVNDGKGGEDVKTFDITVTDVNPNYKVFINFTEGSWVANAPWNNTNKKPVLGDVFPGLKDELNRNTGIALNVMTPWQNINGGANTNNQGANTNNNSGIYPDAVTVSSWWTTTVKQTIKLTGVDTNYRYSFTFFGSRVGISDNRIALYRLNDTATAELNATNNTGNTVTINNIRSNAAGEIVLDLEAAPTSSGYAYLNSLVLNATYDDGKAPAKAGSLGVRIIPEGARLSWVDRAFSESGYSVYRATSAAGPYNLIGSPAANDTAYTDANITASTTYHYYVTANNSYGTTSSDTVSILVPNRAPNLAAIANVVMKTTQIRQIAITATDDPADVLTLSATGLPSFATLQTTGNGTGTITLSPLAANIGTFNITVKAVDNHGLQSSRDFTVKVTDNLLTSVFVKFNRVEPAPAPWNNFETQGLAGRAITNILDESGAATTISVTLVDGMGGDNNNGAVTGNNTGVFPDVVMKTYYFDQSGTPKRIRISGLSTTSTARYNLIFFGSREGVTDNRNTIYAVGAQSVTLNAASNTTQTVALNGLSADASGNIEFTYQQAPGSFAGYMGALVIQSYVDNGVPLAPDNLVTSNATTNSLKLTWTDKSSTETGFELWRSTERNGTYTKVTTTAANVTTYTNTGLAANTTYFYKVRAITASTQSPYSAIATGSTLSYSVYINFNTVNPAPAPWNNTTALPFEGQTMVNPKDNLGNPTSFSWTLLENFTGTNPAGQQTGNNSGVYPDLVLAESYYVEPGDTARMLFTGMDQSKEYAFTFFGSRGNGGTRVGAYSINGRTVTLDANNNTSNTVTIDKVVADENGEVLVKVYVATAYGYLNALVVSASPREVDPLARLAARDRNSGIGNVYDASANANTTSAGNDDLTINSVYPNPFNTFVNLSITLKKPVTKAVIRLVDLTGRTVMVKDLGSLNAGTYNQRVDLGAQVLAKGIYLLQLSTDSKPGKTVKLIKN